MKIKYLYSECILKMDYESIQLAILKYIYSNQTYKEHKGLRKSQALLHKGIRILSKVLNN